MPEIADLPVAKGSDPVGRAVARLKKEPGHHLVVELDDGSSHVLAAEDVLRAKHRGLASVGEIKKGRKKLTTPKIALEGPEAALGKGGAVFGSSRARFALLKRSGARALILSRHETFLSVGEQCACANCGYGDSAPPAQDGQQCPRCGESTLDCA